MPEYTVRLPWFYPPQCRILPLSFFGPWAVWHAWPYPCARWRRTPRPFGYCLPRPVSSGRSDGARRAFSPLAFWAVPSIAWPTANVFVQASSSDFAPSSHTSVLAVGFGRGGQRHPKFDRRRRQLAAVPVGPEALSSDGPRAGSPAIVACAIVGGRPESLSGKPRINKAASSVWY